MLNKARDMSQTVNNGNGYQAKGDIVINNYGSSSAIQFYEKDIERVIVYFAKEVETIGDELDDFHCPGIEEKNRINNLSPGYFNYMKKTHLHYFKKIKVFLQDPKNRKYLKMYQVTVAELNHKIMVNKSKFTRFEEVFQELVDYIISKNNEGVIENRDLLIIFLHFMYWNCDIGDKYD